MATHLTRYEATHCPDGMMHSYEKLVPLGHAADCECYVWYCVLCGYCTAPVTYTCPTHRDV